MRSIWGALLALLIAGCGPPTLYDVDGRPVREPALIAPVDGGWIAVDSTAAGIRAVLELQVPTPDRSVRPTSLDRVLLQVGTRFPIPPVKLREGVPRCWPSLPDRIRCRHQQVETGACVHAVQPGEECYYALCAEFILHKLPDLDDPVLLAVGDSVRTLRLAVVK